jgi:hypothetical protein
MEYLSAVKAYGGPVPYIDGHMVIGEEKSDSGSDTTTRKEH